MIKYIFLGIVQGLTEFFPVSSSGHLVVLQKLMGINEHQLAVSVILHLGTLAALFIFFFKDIIAMLSDFKRLSLVVIVTLVTGVIAILGKDFFESLFSAPKLVALGWIASGIILILTRKFMLNSRNNVNVKDACVLGATQGMAIIPGLSRSGVTISTLLFRGLDKKTSFTFSFLASMPAILGAALLEAKDINSILNMEPVNLFIGFVCSLLAGLLALKVLYLVLHKAKLYYFGYYCIIIAIVTLLFIK